MTPKWVWISLGIALVAIVALVFVFPHQMVSPGNLRPAHAELQQSCFACHVPFGGATTARCVTCHTVADIGRRTTKGMTIARPGSRPPFHQSLASQDCMACHTDHPRPQLTRNLVRSFDHARLEPQARAACSTCHNAPPTDFHRGANLPCGQCHSVQGWKPATFDHSRYFNLAGPHDAACSTCHVGGNFRAFTCYGCHAHQQGQIEAEHREEGLRNIQNCVRCHRSADGEQGEGDARED
jgi:hypothetical protein